MNAVKFREDRKHKSRDKRRIVEVHCELLQVSSPRFTRTTIVARFRAFAVARNFQHSAAARCFRVRPILETHVRVRPISLTISPSPTLLSAMTMKLSRLSAIKVTISAKRASRKFMFLSFSRISCDTPRVDLWRN